MTSCESAPWADTMKTEEREGHGDGEGIPPNSSDWTIFDWDNYDIGILLHELIMVHYSLISMVRIGRRQMRNGTDVLDDVINLLSTSIDNLTEIREDVPTRRLF